MNKLFLVGLILSFFLSLFSSCSNGVDFGEQYKKIIYIVKSENDTYIRQHKITAQEQEGVLSVYCGGSDILKEDVKVTLALDEKAMEAYNVKTFDQDNQHNKLVLLPTQYYTFPSYSITIKAGTEYTKFPIILKTENIDTDIKYAIPLSISETSHYEVNENLKTIFYRVDLINDYSGNFSGLLQVVQANDTIFIARDKSLKAIKEKQVRTSIYNLKDENAGIENLETNLMLLTVGIDNKVKISPWKDAEITDLGSSVYIPKEAKFRLHYMCKDPSGKSVEIIEELVSNEAVVY